MSVGADVRLLRYRGEDGPPGSVAELAALSAEAPQEATDAGNRTSGKVLAIQKFWPQSPRCASIHTYMLMTCTDCYAGL